MNNVQMSRNELELLEQLLTDRLDLIEAKMATAIIRRRSNAEINKLRKQKAQAFELRDKLMASAEVM